MRWITEYYKLNEYLQKKIVSADAYCRKPETKIYEITLKRLGATGDEYIFINNSAINLQATNKFGIDAILFNRDDEEYDGKVIYSFDKLKHILY